MVVVQFVDLHLRTVIYIYIKGILDCVFNPEERGWGVGGVLVRDTVLCSRAFVGTFV